MDGSVILGDDIEQPTGNKLYADEVAIEVSLWLVFQPLSSLFSSETFLASLLLHVHTSMACGQDEAVVLIVLCL
jgi:hypothetical protein